MARCVDPATVGTVDFVVVDVETACSRVSSIRQIGIVGFCDGREAFAYETLVDPRDTFSPFNTRVHGIGSDHVAGKPTFARVHGTVAAHLSGRVTVAHSLFDKGALAAACRVHDRQAIETTWLDSVRVARRAWPDLPSHRLDVLTRYLGVPHRHHDALSDARAAGIVVVRAIDHTGIDLAGWLRPASPRGGPAPTPAAGGPLKGHRAAVLGAFRDGALGHWLAASGARVVASVGRTSTMLVISRDQPFGRFVHASAPYRRAEELRRGGAALTIVTEDDLRDQTGARRDPRHRAAGSLMTLPDLLAPTYRQMLVALSAWLAKAEAQRGGDAEALLAARLAPDMFPLATQVRFACVQALEGLCRLQWRDFPPAHQVLLDEGRNAGEQPGTMAQAQVRIAETVAVVEAAAAAGIAIDPEAPIAHALPIGMTFDLTAEQYARDWALPQFYFHVMTAYAILRAQGVELGKADYAAHMFAYLRPPAP